MAKKRKRFSWNYGRNEPFPFEYGSDLHLLWGWGQRLFNYISANRPPGRLDCAIFRPDRQAADALMRYESKHREIVAQIRDHLDSTNKKWNLFEKDQFDSTKASADYFMDSLVRLLDRISNGIETICEDTSLKVVANSANTSRLFPGGFPKNPDIRDLVIRLDAEKGKPESERRTNNEIARELTGETKDSFPKANSLLTQIRTMKRKGRVIL